MSELIRVKNASYSRYEELLLQRDQVKKEALLYQQNYIAEFGTLILAVFQTKITCIKKKKTIAFCQMAANRGEAVDTSELQNYLENEMQEFHEQLDDMTRDVEAAENAGTVTEVELLQIKKTYHKLVKLIHPDINPMVAESQQLQELWQRTVIAYTCNNLKELGELEMLVTAALEKNGTACIEIDIPDIEEKIAELEAEIKQIKETDPYQYKYLLEDRDLIAEKKKALQEEQKEYENYSDQLEQILTELIESGVSFTWQMN